MSSCEPRKDSSGYNVTKAYHKVEQYKHIIPKIVVMKFSSTACNYYCKSPRQIMTSSSDGVVSTWRMHKYLERPGAVKTSTSISNETKESEPMFTNVNSGTLNLFNYLNWTDTSKIYKLEQEMKAHFDNEITPLLKN